MEQFQRELDLGLEEASKQALLAGQKLEDMSLLEVQERLEEQVQISPVQIEVEIREE